MIAFSNLTKKRRPALPWEDIKNNVLGKKYNLSVVFAGRGLMRKLNKKHRKKDKTADVLSFSLSKDQGEIFMNLSLVENRKSCLLLFIHSLLHLKGFSHSDKMEEKEKILAQKFS